MTDETIDKLKKIFLLKWLVYIVMIVPVFIVIIAAVFLKQKHLVDFTGDTRDVPILLIRNLFGAVSAVELMFSFYIRKNYSHPKKFVNMAKKCGKWNILMNQDIVSRYIQGIDDDVVKRLGGVIQFSNTIDIISWGLCSSISVYGMVLFVLSRRFLYLKIFAGVALIAIASQRPRSSEYIAVIKEAIESGGSDEPAPHETEA